MYLKLQFHLHTLVILKIKYIYIKENSNPFFLKINLK